MKIAIKVYNDAERDKVLRKLEDMGYLWNSGDKPTAESCRYSTPCFYKLDTDEMKFGRIFVTWFDPSVVGKVITAEEFLSEGENKMNSIDREKLKTAIENDVRVYSDASKGAVKNGNLSYASDQSARKEAVEVILKKLNNGCFDAESKPETDPSTAKLGDIRMDERGYHMCITKLSGDDTYVMFADHSCGEIDIDRTALIKRFDDVVEGIKYIFEKYKS